MRLIRGDDRSRIENALDAFATDPYAGDIRALQPPWRGYYRRRVGDWRLIYAIDEKSRVVAVESIALRGEAYRR